MLKKAAPHNPSSDLTEEELLKSDAKDIKNRNITFVFGVVIFGFVVGLSVFTFILSQKEIKKPTPVPLASIEPTSEKKTLDRESIVFEILNASNKKGVASEASIEIQKKGYKVDKIGNSDGEYTQNTIYISRDLTEFKKEIESDLKFFGSLSWGENLDGAKKAKLILAQ